MKTTVKNASKTKPAPAARAGRKPRPAPTTGAKASKREAAEALASAEKPSKKARLISEILQGVTLPASDWRASRHGERCNVLPFVIRGESFSLRPGYTGQGVPVMLAIPRDSDIGGGGASARSQGLIAIHDSLAESGDAYMHRPYYVSREELAQILPVATTGKKGKAYKAAPPRELVAADSARPPGRAKK